MSNDRKKLEDWLEKEKLKDKMEIENHKKKLIDEIRTIGKGIKNPVITKENGWQKFKKRLKHFIFNL